MATPRLQDRLNRWEILNANLKQHLETLPDMTAKQADFEALIAQDVALAAQHSQLIGTARSLTAQRRALTRKGNQLRNIFVAALRHAFGPESQQLNEFGVRPRVFRRRETPSSPQPEPLEQTGSSSIATSTSRIA
jgi:hypothetical protein